MSNKRGKFVALCGVDGAGKSTIISEINKSLLGRNLINIQHPPKEWRENPLILATYRGGNGPKIKDIEEIIYTTSLRIKEQSQVIIPELNRGKMVLSDRYIFCLYSFYYLKRTVEFRKIFEITKDIIIPDLTIFLKISPEEAVRRVNARDEETVEYQKNINTIAISTEAYDVMNRIFNFKVIDSEHLSIGQTANKCLNFIHQQKINNRLMTIADKLREIGKTQQSLDLNRLICRALINRDSHKQRTETDSFGL